mmetsp:Transcript_44072/g.114614  ORF Transcript_44072/g.114614 Transcript_44072/m.114614 type:complete len:281 (-) Transcript_44072:78-920(-)
MSFEESWTSAELASAVCDAQVKRGQLKEKPAFIRNDRQAKIVSVFESVGLDGAKMASFDNPGPIEMLVRRGTNGEPWVAQVTDVLIKMLPEDVQHAAKKMGMDEDTKAQLEAAKEKTAQRRERLEEQKTEEKKDDGGGGRGGGRAAGGDREGGRGGGGDRGDRPERPPRGDRGDWDGDERPSGGRRESTRGEGGSTSTMECYNCGAMGHSSRDCPEPRKEKGGGKGKGNRREMICVNCKKPGHKSRDCPEPVDEAAVAARLAARAAKAEQMRSAADEGSS